MKTNNFLRTKALAVALAMAATMITSAGSISFAAEGQNGNGGGGVNINGRHMTFFSAGLVVDKQELSLAQIPQLKTAIDAMMMSSYLPSNVTAQYFKALMPSQTRRYYNVSATHFTPETRARLIAEYSRVMSVDGTKIALFAVTDTTANTTYLLPEFYSLRKPSEQAAILFHEAYWIVNPKVTYQQVITVEASFQAYLENANSPEALFNWLEQIVSGDALVRAAYGMDTASGALAPLMDKPARSKKDRSANGLSLPISNLIGADAAAQGFLCQSNGRHGHDTCSSSSSGPTAMVLQNLYVKSLQYPQSWLIKILIAQISTNKAVHVNSYNSLSSCVIAPYSKNEAGALSLHCSADRGYATTLTLKYIKD